MRPKVGEWCRGTAMEFPAAQSIMRLCRIGAFIHDRSSGWYAGIEGLLLSDFGLYDPLVGALNAKIDDFQQGCFCRIIVESFQSLQ